MYTIYHQMFTNDYHQMFTIITKCVFTISLSLLHNSVYFQSDVTIHTPHVFSNNNDVWRKIDRFVVYLFLVRPTKHTYEKDLCLPADHIPTTRNIFSLFLAGHWLVLFSDPNRPTSASPDHTRNPMCQSILDVRRETRIRWVRSTMVRIRENTVYHIRRNLDAVFD